jgi:hypothetical protein
MSISSVIGDPTGIAPFGDPNMGNFFRGDEDGGESSSERDLGMWTVFYYPPRRDSVPKNFINITFINVF